MTILIKTSMIFNYSPKYCCCNFLFIKTFILEKTDLNAISRKRINIQSQLLKLRALYLSISANLKLLLVHC